MPDRTGGWMKSSPLGFNSYVNKQNDRLSKRAKQVIRLVKAWNYYAEAGIRSIYLELRVTEYLAGESTVIYPLDVCGALRHLSNKGLAAMHDPLGLGSMIFPCSDAAKVSALSKLSTALTRANKAVLAKNDGKAKDAFDWWDKLYQGRFPGYY
jgi:hypothetical protein